MDEGFGGPVTGRFPADNWERRAHAGDDLPFADEGEPVEEVEAVWFDAVCPRCGAPTRTWSPRAHPWCADCQEAAVDDGTEAAIEARYDAWASRETAIDAAHGM
jgi:hypothetical protein